MITGGELHHAGKGSSGSGAGGAGGTLSSVAARAASCWAFVVDSVSVHIGCKTNQGNAAAQEQQRKFGSHVEMVGGSGSSQPRQQNGDEGEGDDEDERSLASRASSTGTRSTAPSVTSQV